MLGRKPVGPPREQLTDELDVRSREDILVETWRLEQFLTMQFSLPAAERLAASAAHLRDVERMLGKGCSHELALRISL